MSRASVGNAAVHPRHLIAFAADEAMNEARVVEIEDVT